MLIYQYIINDFECLKMLSKVQKFFINLKQTHFFMFTFLTLVFLHALFGSIAVIFSYKIYSVLSFIIALVILYIPFTILLLAIYLELILYKKYPNLVNFLIYSLNSLLIIIQFLTTNLTLLYIFNEIG